MNRMIPPAPAWPECEPGLLKEYRRKRAATIREAIKKARKLGMDVEITEWPPARDGESWVLGVRMVYMDSVPSPSCTRINTGERT